ncbi:MAG: hypothetical protein WC548_03535 [Candidatus Pacearchaeota archaeon]
MSKLDCETCEYLLPVYIEFGFGREPHRLVCVNTATFESCFSRLTPPLIDNKPNCPQEQKTNFCSVYGTVGRTVITGDSFAYVNGNEPPISRTLMGYIPSKTLEEKLPSAFEDLVKVGKLETITK